jgi:hypothetical protein
MKNKKENTPDNPDISVEQAFNPDNEYKPKKDTQNRNWIFTVNNPKLTEQEFYDYLKSVENVKYFTFQREKDSTEHHQSYIEFSAPKKFSTMKNIFSNDKMGVNAHIYPRRGSKREAHDYAKKIGEYAYKAYTKISDNYEFGTFVDHGERTDINDMIEMRKNGASHNEIRESYGSYVNFYKRVNFFANESRNELFKTTFRKMENTYIFGESEQGKSRYATDLYGFKGVY